MPGTAKVVSLTVRPSEVSHLCFGTDGIIGEFYMQAGQGTLLGQQVTPFDFAGLYNSIFTNQGSTDPSRLFFDANKILARIGTNALASLRAESAKVAVSNAINARQNAYFAKLGPQQQNDIISQMTQNYSPTRHDSKPYRLNELVKLADAQVGALKAEYKANKRTGVQKTTSSVSTTTGGGSTMTGRTEMESEEDQTDPFILPELNAGGAGDALGFSGGFTTDNSNTTFQEESSGQTIKNTGKITQKITNTDYGYRYPNVECQAQYQRARISFIDQQFAQFLYSVNFPNLSQVFQNELSNIDGNVYRLQIAYANTILMSPIAGTVTGVYKNPGDAVRAGEPVIRVENNATIFLVGTLIYPGLIQIGSSVKVTTTMLYGAPGAIDLPGTVVAARGQGQEDQWAVIVQCNNPTTTPSGSAVQTYPLGYNFDYDDTTVTITN